MKAEGCVRSKFQRIPIDRFSFEVILPVALPHFPQDFAGVPHGDDVRRKVLRDDAPRTHDDVVAQSHPGQENGARTDPVRTGALY